MSQTKVQLIAPIGVVTASTLETTGVLTATTFVGDIAGTVTGITSTTDNLNLGIVTATSFAGDFTGIGSGLTGTPNVVAGIVTATKFVGNTPGLVSGVADGTNINAGIITATSFVGNLTGNAAGLSTTTANLNLGIVTATSFAGNFTGVASGITGTPNIVVGIMTGTLNGDGSSLTGIAATNWIANNVTANSSTTAIDLALGNVVKFTQSASTTVSFANTGTSNIVSFIRVDDNSGTDRTITWPSAIKWTGGQPPTLVNNTRSSDYQVFTLLTRDEGVTWYGWETVNNDPQTFSMWGWGINQYGNLGQNNVTTYSSPRQVGSDTSWSSSTLGNHSLGSAFGIKNDATMWAWGYNLYGDLAINSRTYYSSPVQVPGTTWLKVNRAYRGAGAIKTDGTLWTWGANNNGSLGQNAPENSHRSSPVQLGSRTDWKDFTPTYYNTTAIRTDGTLWAWGFNTYGNLGLNNKTVYSSPVQIPGTTWDKVCYNGFHERAAIKTDGTLWMWGRNNTGQLGQNNKTEYSSPKQIPGTTWANISCDQNRVMATKTDGTLWTWGGSGRGEMGLNDNDTYRSSPTQIPGTDWDTEQFLASAGRSLARKTDGTLWAWGSNQYGGLGINQPTPSDRSSPTQIPGTAWAKVYVGNSGFVALQQSD